MTARKVNQECCPTSKFEELQALKAPIGYCTLVINCKLMTEKHYLDPLNLRTYPCSLFHLCSRRGIDRQVLYAFSTHPPLDILYTRRRKAK